MDFIMSVMRRSLVIICSNGYCWHLVMQSEITTVLISRGYHHHHYMLLGPYRSLY
jgi:hypothetical protein